MKKFKHKIFLTIFLILTISVISFILVFNTQNYIQLKNNIQDNLNQSIQNNDMMGEKKDLDKKPEIKFMDATLYTVLLDENDNIKDVINHSNNSISNSKIKKIANNILDSNKKETYIGFLYLENYSYTYKQGNSLVILDNSKTKMSLIISLELSLAIFIILEIIIFLISKFITDKIVKPVNDTFEKQKIFIADASHELKTPLSVIIASTEALEDNYDKKWIKNIKLESDRMSKLIKDLLDLSSSEYKSHKSIKDLSKVTELSILTFEGKAFEENVKLEYDIQDNIKFNIEESSIKQLIEILLDNAIKHSYKNKTIKVTLKENKNNITLLVQNSGKPIPKGEEEKIFERFYRIDKSRNRKEGRYGLGLAIAKNIVINHDGVISAYSDNDITTFKVLFKK